MGVPSVPVEIGEMLAGKYRVERILGHGGMGVVVAATHVQLDQHVAIKFLLPDALANSDVVARFQREARAAVKIQSEHVARVIDVGTLESGAPYMVMEYLEGADLSQKIASSGPVTVHEAVRYLLEACEALAEAHHAGIVHRDLKPANLFLARRADKTSIVKVLDFGISKSSVGGGGGITSTQAVMGSPYYMSPEQLMSAKHVDARSDIWSLGIVLHEALVGVPPYSGESIAEIVAQILQAPAPSVRAKRPDVPPEIDRIIATCLAKDPNARYRDVGALARDLAGLIPDGTRSMDRIARVLGTSVSPPVMQTAQTLPLSASGSGSVTPLTPIPDVRGGTVAMQRSGSISHPQEAWGATNAGPPKRSNMPLIAAAIGVVVLLGGIALTAMLVLKKEPKAETQTAAGITEPAHTSAAKPDPLPVDTTPLARPSFAATTPPPPAPEHVDVGGKTVVTAPPRTTHGGTKPAATVAVAPPPATTKGATPAPPPPATQTRSALDMGIK